MKRKTFKSWLSYFDYEHALKHRSRYIHIPEIKQFLQTVLETARNRIKSIPKDRFLWRAQLGHDWRQVHEENVHAPHSPERMQPMLGRAAEGRVNPKGIPYLYLSSNRETALAEVRPWVGSYVSVGQFKILKDLKVVYCTTERKGLITYEKEPRPKEREKAVWADIDEAFARPVTPTDDVADYVPTQVIAEFFKANSFDGIVYRSSLGTGYNAALFDVGVADIINCFLFEVCNIKFDFEETANPYFISKH